MTSILSKTVDFFQQLSNMYLTDADFFIKCQQAKAQARIDAETEFLISQLSNVQKTETGGYPFFEGNFGNKKIIICKTFTGMENSAAAGAEQAMNGFLHSSKRKYNLLFAHQNVGYPAFQDFDLRVQGRHHILCFLQKVMVFQMMPVPLLT